MKILFMGTPEFAVSSLKKLYDSGHEICGVFTQPDKPKNRGMKLEFSPVKILALKHETPVFQPAKMRDGSALAIINSLEPEIIVVVAYGRILPKEILDYPKFGCLNIHGSILPKYRGAAPVQWSVLNGDKITGVTAMYMDEGLDTGDILAVKTTPIGELETSGELFIRLQDLAAELLVEVLESIENGTAVRMKQDDKLATKAPPLTKDLCPIDFNHDTKDIINKIRGLNPWPTATADIGGKNFKIYSASNLDSKLSGEPGSIVFADKRGLAIYTGDGALLIEELQAPGGKRMSAKDYLRGHPIC